MANMRDQPVTITGTAGSANAFGNATATVTINGSTYTCAGDTQKLADLALARRLVEEGYEPTTSLVVGAVTIADIISAD